MRESQLSRQAKYTSTKTQFSGDKIGFHFIMINFLLHTVDENMFSSFSLAMKNICSHARDTNKLAIILIIN